jgi:hypothetical protein
MLVTGIEWITEGYDIHMVPGAIITPSLLKIHHDPPNDPPDPPWTWASNPIANVIVNFEPKIRDAGSGLVHKFGIELNTVTGRLQIDQTLPSPRLYNFIIEATVVDNNASIPNTFKSAIRIHVHNRLVTPWLTPSKLSIRLGSDGHRFSVLAVFQDDVAGVPHDIVADITRFPSYTWTSSNQKVNVDPESGKLSAQPISNADDVIITASLPSEFDPLNIHHISAKVDVLPSWSELESDLKLVNRSEIAQEEIDKFPNILFISEGYKSKEVFDRCVRWIVENIKSKTSVMPFNLLSERNRLNYWSTFIESSEEVSSALYPILDYQEGMIMSGYSINPYYTVKPDTNNSTSWTLAELIYVVGMPILADYDEIDDEPTYMKKLEEWEKLFVDPNNIDLRIKAPISIWREWKVLGRYILANETNTALGLSAGSRPNIQLNVKYSPGSLGWHPLRTTRIQFDEFLKKLKTTDNIPIGEYWASGKDREHVIALCLESTAKGTRFPEPNPLLSLSFLDNKMLHRLKKGIDNSSSTDIEPNRSATADLNFIAHTTCHELSHTLGLGDEIGRLDFMPDDPDIETGVNKRGNLQSHSKLMNSPPEIGINGNKIKWNWPRIRKAGVLKKDLESTATGFKIELDMNYRPLYNKNYFKDRENFFRRGELVRLRQHPLPLVKTSKEFKISSISSAGDIIEIESINTEAFDPAEFLKGSLLIAIRPILPEFPDDPPFREIVHKAVRNHINVSKSPLNAPRQSSSSPIPYDCLRAIQAINPRPKGTDKQYPKNIPPLRHPSSRNLYTIIGVYDGGNGYHCNVYHPSGYCELRSTTIARFCHVCRYFLVDQLDPSLHAEIDREYEWNYPFR